MADAYRLGVQVVLPNATETMRRYPQFAAGLPFQFGSLYGPVMAWGTTFGVLTVLRPSAADAAEVLRPGDKVLRWCLQVMDAEQDGVLAAHGLAAPSLRAGGIDRRG